MTAELKVSPQDAKLLGLSGNVVGGPDVFKPSTQR